jgi:hypothetical protein
VKQIFVEEIGDVADDSLRMDVVRGRILGRSAVEVESKPFTLLRQRKVAGADKRRRPSDRIVEHDSAKFSVRQRPDFLARSFFRRFAHPAHQPDNKILPALFDQLEQAHANAVRRRAASAQIRDKHGRRAKAVHGVKLEEIFP